MEQFDYICIDKKDISAFVNIFASTEGNSNIRTNVTNGEEFSRLLNDVSRKAKVGFIVNSRITNPSVRHEWSKTYVCRHSGQDTVHQDLGCKLRIKVRIKKITRRTIYRDKLVEKFPCLVRVVGEHSHEIAEPVLINEGFEGQNLAGMNPSKNLSTNCLLCQSNTGDSSANKNSRNTSAFSSWNESCASSLCQAFNLDDKFYRKVFLDAKYCSQCLLIIRNIDFTLKNLQCLQQNLDSSRDAVEMLLRNNYENIQTGNEGVKEEILDPEYMDTSWMYSYDRTVTKIYETISTREHEGRKSPSDRLMNMNTVDHSAFRSYIGGGEEFIDYDVEDEQPAGSARLTRNRKSTGVTTSCYTADPEDEPDFASDVEHLSDNNEDSNFEIENETDDNFEDTISSSNSEDSDWEAAHNKKFKKKSSKITKDGPSRKLKFVSRENSNLTSAVKKRVVIVDGNASTGITRSAKRCTYDSCSFTVRSKIKLDAHINKIHKGEDQPFHCEVCKGESKNYKFGSATSYYYHQKKCHSIADPNIVCEICKKSFIVRWELKKHVKLAHAEHTTKLKCVYCKKMFDEDQPEELAKHEVLHSSKEKPFACVLCEKDGFTNSVDLCVHVRQEHEESLEKCETCNKTFNTKKRLQGHIDATHKERNPALKCPQCPFIALYKSALGRHIDWHSNQRNFQCDMCPNNYKTQSCLNYHINVTHGKDKAFKCKLCDKTFGSTCQLKAHEESHNTVKTYCCDLCGKAFMAKKHLEQHIRGHNGTLKKYKKKPAPGSGPRKRKLDNSTVGTSITTSTSSEVSKQDESTLVLPVPVRPNILQSNDPVVGPISAPPALPVAGPATVSMLDTWSNSTQNPYFSLPVNPVMLQLPQYPPGLDLSQGGSIINALNQHHHNAFVSDRYSYT